MGGHRIGESRYDRRESNAAFNGSSKAWRNLYSKSFEHSLLTFEEEATAVSKAGLYGSHKSACIYLCHLIAQQAHATYVLFELALAWTWP